MQRLTSSTGSTISYARWGDGPPLVVVHGGFSDHDTNWKLVQPILRDRFTVYALARRGRGETDATVGHSLEDEAADVAALVEAIGEPVFLLGHSYGAQCALAAALLVPDRVRKLVLYEPPGPATLTPAMLGRLEDLAAAESWDDFAVTFFRDGLSVPVDELDGLRDTPLWAPIVTDAKATLGDLRALARHPFEAERCRRLGMPVLLQVGSESPRDLYVTDALAAVLRDGRVEELRGQAHEGMTTAPDLYAERVTAFLLS